MVEGGVGARGKGNKGEEERGGVKLKLRFFSARGSRRKGRETEQALFERTVRSRPGLVRTF